MRWLLIAVLILSASCNNAETNDYAMPEGWPRELGLYPGSSVMMNNDLSYDNNPFRQLVLNSPDHAHEIARFYREKARLAGYETFYYSELQDWATGVFTKGDRDFRLMCSQTKQPTRAMLFLEPSRGEIRLHAEGHLPVGFPKDELPLLPDASVLTAADRASQAVLIMESAAPIESIVDYYSNEYAKQGYEAEPELLKDADDPTKSRMAEFTKGDNYVLLIIEKPVDGLHHLMLSLNRE